MSAPDDTREKILSDWCPDYSTAGRRALLAELDRTDPLRALLADDDRLIEWATRARHRAASYDNWDEWPDWAKDNWQRETRTLCWPVLAALKEVAAGADS